MALVFFTEWCNTDVFWTNVTIATGAVIWTCPSLTIFFCHVFHDFLLVLWFILVFSWLFMVSDCSNYWSIKFYLAFIISSSPSSPSPPSPSSSSSLSSSMSSPGDSVRQEPRGGAFCVHVQPCEEVSAGIVTIKIRTPNLPPPLFRNKS